MSRPTKRKAQVEYDRTPPQNIEAERSVLGAMLINPDAVGAAVEILRYSGEEMFYLEPHQYIYDAMVGCFSKAQPIDAVSMIDKLTQSGRLADAGGASYLAELTRAVPTSANVVVYANIVRDCAMLRHVIQTATRMATEAYTGEVAVDDIIARFQTEVNQISEQKSSIAVVSAYSAAQSLTNEVSEMLDAGKRMRGIETGLSGLDDILNGFQKKQLVIIGARPSVGKTALALSFAMNAGIELQIPTLIFSLEMPKEELCMRLMQAQGDVSTNRIMSGWQAKGEIPKMQQVTNILEDARLHIVDDPNVNILDVKAIARKFVAKQKAEHGIIIIDYLQLMNPVDRKIPRQEQVAEMSREAKRLAMELGWTVIALSQMNRKGDESDKQRLRLSHLRESGAIEQDANVVMLINEEPGGNTTITNISIDIAKNRGGAKGVVFLTYNKQRQTFHMQTNAKPPVGGYSVPASAEVEYYEDDEDFDPAF
jgi:replicative DNA helicase